MILASIQTGKIDKALLNKSTSGKTFLNIALIPGKNGKDEYGNDGFIVQSVSKEERARGVKGPIIGNWKDMDKPAQPRQQKLSTECPEDDVPF